MLLQKIETIEAMGSCVLPFCHIYSAFWGPLIFIVTSSQLLAHEIALFLVFVIRSRKPFKHYVVGTFKSGRS